jgi:hypothetical protein
MSAKARRTFRTIGSTSFTWDQASTAAGAAAVTTTSVPGAQPGDSVLVTPLTHTAGIVYTGIVSAKSVVPVRGQNVTAGAVDPASTSLAVLVLRP